MQLSDFLMSAEWAIRPDALDSLFQSLLSATSNTEQPLQASLSAYDKGSARTSYTLQDGVALIEIEGVLHCKAGDFLWFSWSGQDQIKHAITEALQDEDAHSILLSFNSPGGVAAGVKELADFIAAQTAKPIYAYADGLCASAAYWLAAATGKVYAPLTATIGSIGVLQVHCDRSVANATKGLKYTYVASGTWKAAGNPDTPLSTSDQAHLQASVSKLHTVFRNDVAAYMPVDTNSSTALGAWGDGQCFLGEEALELGLVSGIVSDLDALIQQINKETFMDKTQFAKAHPELLAQIQAEAKAEGKAEGKSEALASLEQEQKTASVNASVTTAAIVKLVAGEDVAAQVSNLMTAGFTVAQIEALAPMLQQKVPAPALQADATPGAQQDTGSRVAILAALEAATPDPLDTATNNPPPQKCALLADAERRAKQ